MPGVWHLKTIKTKKVSGFAHFLCPWILCLALFVVRLAIMMCVYTQSLQGAKIDQPQGLLKIQIELVQFINDFGRSDGLTFHQVEVRLGDSTLARFRGVQNIKGSVIPSASAPAGQERVSTLPDNTPNWSVKLNRFECLHCVKQHIVSNSSQVFCPLEINVGVKPIENGQNAGGSVI